MENNLQSRNLQIAKSRALRIARKIDEEYGTFFYAVPYPKILGLLQLRYISLKYKVSIKAVIEVIREQHAWKGATKLGLQFVNLVGDAAIKKAEEAFKGRENTVHLIHGTSLPCYADMAGKVEEIKTARVASTKTVKPFRGSVC